MCICDKPIPTKDIIEVTNLVGAVQARFNKTCPEHGIGESLYRDLIKVVKSNWVTVQEAVRGLAFYRSREELRIVRRSPDGKQALLEWVEWEMPNAV